MLYLGYRLSVETSRCFRRWVQCCARSYRSTDSKLNPNVTFVRSAPFMSQVANGKPVVCNRPKAELGAPPAYA